MSEVALYSSRIYEVEMSTHVFLKSDYIFDTHFELLYIRDDNRSQNCLTFYRYYVMFMILDQEIEDEFHFILQCQNIIIYEKNV